MHDADKTKAQLIAELTALRQRVAALEPDVPRGPTHDQEMTERGRAEAELQASEARFRQLVEGSIQGIMIHRGGTPVFANQAYASIYGYDSPEDILQVDNIFQDIIAPEDRARLEHYFQARLRGDPVPTHYICRGVRRDGRSIWVENIVTVVTWWGETAIQSTVVDISERKQTEEALRASEARLRAFADALPDLVFVLDEHGRYVEVLTSQKHLLYRGVDQLQGRRLHDVLPKQDADRFLDTVRRTLSTRQSQVLEYTLDVLAGQRWFEGRTSPMSSPCASVGMVVWVSRDITDRKRAAEDRRRLEVQLHQAQKMQALGTLAGGIAHEFNNMLSAILGYTELIQYEVSPDSQAWANAQEVLKASERAKNLVRQILVFGRPQDHARQPVQIASVLQDVLKLLRASLPTTIDIRQQLAPETGTVLADANQIHQVLMNLCVNAEYAMRHTGGILEIGISQVEADEAMIIFQADLQPGSYIRVTVRDTGAGIAAEDVERLFEPFFTTKDIGEGTGMGLAIVHSIVTSHGGAITVESALGEGTTFSVYFPQLTQATPDVPQVSAHMLARGRGHILFVDDEDMLVRLGQMFLEHLGYTVVACTSSLEALHTFKAEPNRFDLIITDQTMPAMTGDTLMKELRRIRPDIPVILCTGFSHQMNAEKAQALGVDAFVMKPAEPQELALTIQQVLAKRECQKG